MYPVLSLPGTHPDMYVKERSSWSLEIFNLVNFKINSKPQNTTLPGIDNTLTHQQSPSHRNCCWSCPDNETGPAAVAEKRRDPMVNHKK